MKDRYIAYSLAEGDKKMIKNRTGFTLMEIMVVIIVIAVLASVAGPMIGSITDQGRASATKSKLSSLKSAMLAYQNDVGRLPFTGNADQAGKIGAYCAPAVLSGTDLAKNVLVTEEVAGVCDAISNYGRKWKGPYMDSDPSDFMYDSWGNEIVYEAVGNNVYLISVGPDGARGNLQDALNAEKIADGTEDDIVLSVARVRKAFTN